MEGWYSTQVVFPELDAEIVWITPDGREIVGMYKGQNGWHALTGERFLYTPLRWRYADDIGPALSTK